MTCARRVHGTSTACAWRVQALESRQLLRKISAAEAESATQEALKHLKALSMGDEQAEEPSGGAGEASSSLQPVVVGSEAEGAAPLSSGPIVFCVGGPGAGKTTVCHKLEEKYRASYYAVGDLLRDEVKKGSETGRRIADMIKEGKIVPTQVTIDLLKAVLSSSPGPYLIEGFPRTLESLAAFEEQCGQCSALLYLEFKEEAMQARESESPPPTPPCTPRVCTSEAAVLAGRAVVWSGLVGQGGDTWKGRQLMGGGAASGSYVPMYLLTYVPTDLPTY